MNALDGKRMNEVFFEYYHLKQIKDLNKDKEMLDKLVRAGYTEYILEGDKAYAQATVSGKRLHRPPSGTV